MYTTSDLYKTILANPLHYKETKFIISGVEYTEKNIISAVIPPSSIYEKFGIGNCVARELDIELFPVDEIPRQAEIKAYTRLVLDDQMSEWIPQGVFYISTRKKNKLTGSLAITAFDSMLKAEETWLTEDYDLDDWPKTQRDAVDDIAFRMGLEVDPRTVLSDDFPVNYPVDENGDLTMREVLSGIGASNAANWIITIEGKLLQICATESGEEILLDNGIEDLDIGEPSLPVSKIILNVDRESCYTAGDDTGYTIEADCPWATQAMANSVLAITKGFVYQPFDGADALLDLAAELGDTITVGGMTSILAKMGRNLDRQSAASIGAPGTDEIEDEYPYKTKQKKQSDRAFAKVNAKIAKTINSITLTVTNDEDGTSSSFVLKSGETVLSSGNISFDGYVTFKGLEEGTTVIDGGCIQTGTILANLIKAGVLQSKDGETFKLDLDNGTFSMIGTGRFQSPDGKSYISVEGDEMVLYAKSASGEYFDKLRLGFITQPNTSGTSTIDYPYMLFGKSTSSEVGLIKKFVNGFWVGNSAPLSASGNFEGYSGAAGIFVNTKTGQTYVVDGYNMQNVYTGAAVAKFK